MASTRSTRYALDFVTMCAVVCSASQISRDKCTVCFVRSEIAAKNSSDRSRRKAGSAFWSLRRVQWCRLPAGRGPLRCLPLLQAHPMRQGEKLSSGNGDHRQISNGLLLPRRYCTLKVSRLQTRIILRPSHVRKSLQMMIKTRTCRWRL